MYDEIRYCISCGKEYRPYRYDQSTCGGKECVKKIVNARKRQYNKEYKAKQKMKKRTGTQKVMGIDSMARAEGLSYGKYVAKYGL